MKDFNGHRISPGNKRLLFDKECWHCECPRMADIWEEVLNISATDMRKTLNVAKLREVIKEIIGERV